MTPEQITEHARAVAAQAPPLTEDQRNRLRVLLRATDPATRRPEPDLGDEGDDPGA